MSIKKPKEQDILTQCLQWLRLHGCFVWRQNQGAFKVQDRFVRFSHQKGISDIIGMLPNGRFLAIECKQPSKKPTAVQADFLAEVKAKNGIAICVTSVDELATKVTPLL